MNGPVSLVTGGAGFIGSHLCDALLAKKHRVICIDNLLTGSKANIGQALANPRFTFINADVSDKIVVSEHIDYIFHFASPASVVDYQKYPIETALVNSRGTHNLLELARKHSARFLFASTSEVYGDPKEHPQKETYWGNVNPNGIRSCYDESKRFGEMITMVYLRQYDVDGRIIRIFNTYGPRTRPTDGRVISNMVVQAINNESLTVYGDGTQTRSFCYVSDLVSGIMDCMFVDVTRGEVVNLGNPHECTIMDLANMIVSLTNTTSEIVHKEIPVDDPVRRCPDIQKATTLLGWKPRVSLEEGLKKTIAFFNFQKI